jgi:hypothetical protein
MLVEQLFQTLVEMFILKKNMLYIGSKVIAARKGCGYATFYFIGLSCVK